MSPQQLVALSSRLFSLWLGFQSIQYFVAAFLPEEPQPVSSVLAFLIVAGLHILAAVLLWRFPFFIGRKLLPKSDSADTDKSLYLPPTQAATVGCVVLGLCLLLWHVLPNLSRFVVMLAMMMAKGMAVSSYTEFALSRVGPVLIELVVALVLCLKAHAIARYLTTERTLPAKTVE